MIDNHHLVYIGVLAVYLIGAMIVAMVGMLVLAAGFAVAGIIRIRKLRKPIAAAQPNEDEPDDVSASQSSRSLAGNPGGVDDSAIGQGRAMYASPAMISPSRKGSLPPASRFPDCGV